MKGLLRWFGEALAHATGATDAEEKRQAPPAIGTQPYRDVPRMRRGHGY